MWFAAAGFRGQRTVLTLKTSFLGRHCSAGNLDMFISFWRFDFNRAKRKPTTLEWVGIHFHTLNNVDVKSNVDGKIRKKTS